MVTVIGLCGSTCSGKTSLCKLLVDECTRRGLYDKTILVEQDNFYKEDAEINVEVDGYKNWDCAEAINMEAFSLEVQRQHRGAIEGGHRTLLIVEGFLLYGTCPAIEDIFTVKFWLDVDEETCKERRLSRDQWLRDNEGYFDSVIWPGHVAYMRRITDATTVLHRLDATEQLPSLLKRILAVLKEDNER